MAKTRLQKEETVADLTEKLARAKALVFADFKGMTMKEFSKLRKSLREVDSEFNVTKNTLLARSLPKNELPEETFNGPTATLFAFDDEISPIKLLVKALKEAGIGKIKAGFLGSPAGGEILDEARVNQLATLPTKNELRAKTVGILAAPIQGIVGVLQGNLRNLVYALNEIKEKRSAVA